MKPKDSGRRRFLKNSAALAGIAVGMAKTAKGDTPAPEGSAAPPKDVHGYGERSRYETSARLGAPGLYDPAPRRVGQALGLILRVADPLGLKGPGLELTSWTANGVRITSDLGGRLPLRVDCDDRGGSQEPRAVFRPVRKQSENLAPGESAAASQ